LRDRLAHSCAACVSDALAGLEFTWHALCLMLVSSDLLINIDHGGYSINWK
jgi:hypothetical protein